VLLPLPVVLEVPLLVPVLPVLLWSGCCVEVCPLPDVPVPELPVLCATAVAIASASSAVKNNRVRII
jgi:hypothetical protein